MSGWKRVVLVAAGLAAGLTGCRSTCTDRSRRPDCDPCAGPRFSAAPRPAAASPCGDVFSAASAGPRQPVVGEPTSAVPGAFIPGPFGPPPVTGSPFAPAVPALPNELPPPMETIPAPMVPLPAVPTAANVLPPPSTPGAITPVSQPK